MLFLLVSASGLMAQDSAEVREQFDELIDKSNDFKEYKVIRRSSILELRNNTVQTIKTLEDRIDGMTQQRELRQDSIVSLKAEIDKNTATISELREDLDEIDVLGLALNKTLYNTIVFSVIGILLLLLIFFISKYKTSHGTIREQRANIEETEKELEDTRQKAIEKEQKLGRMLQDERNKNRHSSS